MILVDGKKDMLSLKKILGHLNSFEEDLMWLIQGGYVASADMGSPMAQSGLSLTDSGIVDIESVKAKAREIIIKGMPSIAKPMVKDLENCTNLAEIGDHLSHCRQIAQMTLGKDKAEKFWQNVKASFESHSS
ncbi:MAG: hypothetical protein ACFCBW_11215 [Candidatus Competibacterales bacterium]